MTRTAKPIAFDRKKALEHDVLIPPHKSFKRMTGGKLDKYEEYYHEVLEALAGKQVWAILDALEYVNTVINERKSSKRKE